MRHTYTRWLVVLLAVLLTAAVTVFALIATQDAGAGDARAAALSGASDRPVPPTPGGYHPR